MKFPKSAEVLSPAGNERMLEAAVRSGADAVYLGAREFSARRNAENFSDDGLKEAVAYCHIRGVKVYLTLNILIKDEELPAAFNLAKTAYNYGVDGIIIQDLGLARALNKLLPGLALHASTQMSVMSPSALEVLKETGFVRVVTAREMSLEELKEFCKEAKRLSLEVEIFVHGALCMSVSGQCLLSAFLGSRSGNRGLCAGPCRLPFSAPGGTGHDLSLKDLSLFGYMSELTEIGVTSFKIEGRMKRPEYVAASTAACRQALDNGFVSNELSDMLKNVFSRSGFTSGYLENKLGKNMFGIRTKEDSAAANEAFPKLHEIYRTERSTVKIDVSVSVKKNTVITLKITDGVNEIIEKGSVPQPAQKNSATHESINKGINKFGSTPYFAEKINIDIDDGLFVRASELNELRRAATEKLDEKRSKIPYKQSSVEFISSAEQCKASEKKVYARFFNSECIPDDLTGIDAIIFPFEKDLKIKNKEIPVFVEMPRGITNEAIIKNRLKKLYDNGIRTAVCGNLSAFKMALDEGFRVIAGTGMNIYNSESAKAVKEMGAVAEILSNELLISDASKLKSPVPKGIIAYGNIPLMLYRNCPLKNGHDCKDCDKKGALTDRLGTKFPVRCRMGFAEMLNSVPVWLADRKKDLISFDFTVLYFTDESKDRARQVIDAYKTGAAPDVKYTRGLFYRGTL